MLPVETKEIKEKYEEYKMQEEIRRLPKTLREFIEKENNFCATSTTSNKRQRRK